MAEVTEEEKAKRAVEARKAIDAAKALNDKMRGGKSRYIGASPCCADVLLGSATWNGQSLGVLVGFAFEESVQDVVIRGELSTSPDCRAPIARDIVCTLSFLCAPCIDPVVNGCTPAELDITAQEADCSTITTYTLPNMVPRGYSRAFNRDSPPAIYSQTFVYMGSLDGTSDPLTITAGVPESQ